jgi:death-on-curing protein
LRNEPNWLPLEAVLEINRDAVAKTGETYLLRDQTLLESALGKPQNHWAYGDEDDVVVLAVHLLDGIAQNHCFEQGNKRTAFIAAVMFLRANGYTLTLPDGDMLGRWVENLVTKAWSFEYFTDMIRPAVKPRQD